MTDYGFAYNILVHHLQYFSTVCTYSPTVAHTIAN